jgi:hypothetical protein
MNKTNLVLMFLILSSLASAATAGELTPQQIAENRAKWICEHNHHWHPSYRIGGQQPGFWLWKHCSFEGLGFGRPRQTVTWSCRPRRRMRLVGEAYHSNDRMSVLVRLWK